MIRYGLFMLTEACWLLAPLVLLDAAAPGAVPPLLAFVALYPAAYLAARYIPIRDERLWVEFAIAAGLALAATLLLAIASWAAGAGGQYPVPRFVLAATIGTLAWIRGWLLARREPASRTFALSFQFGLMVLATVLFFATDAGVPVATQLGLAVALIVFGLGGLWHARAGAKDRLGGTGNPGIMLLGLLAVFALGTLLWLLVDRSALEASLAALQWLGLQLGQVLAYLIGLLPDVTGQAGRIEFVTPPDPVALPQPREIPGDSSRLVGIFVLVLIMGVIVAGGLVALYHFLKSLARHKRRDTTQGLIYGRTGGSLLFRLLASLRALAQRLRQAIVARLARWRETRREGSVRGRYRNLLTRLARRGWPRRIHETPEEYQRRLAPEWPDAAPHLDALTQAFTAARYGGREPDPAVVETLWRQLVAAIGTLRRVNG